MYQEILYAKLNKSDNFTVELLILIQVKEALKNVI